MASHSLCAANNAKMGVFWVDKQSAKWIVVWVNQIFLNIRTHPIFGTDEAIRTSDLIGRLTS